MEHTLTTVKRNSVNIIVKNYLNYPDKIFGFRTLKVPTLQL